MIKEFSMCKLFLVGLFAIAVGVSANSASAETILLESTPSQSLPALEVGSQNPAKPSLFPLLQPQTSEASPSTGIVGVEITQSPVVPGRSTRSGPSYVGIGGNIGLGGDSSLGDTGVAVISKIGLTRNLSTRPSVVIGGNDPTVLVPVTLDFPISSVAEAGSVNLVAAPYIGGGIAISTGSESFVRPLITAGVDVPVAPRITATAGVNFAFFDDTEIGLVLGAGYNF